MRISLIQTTMQQMLSNVKGTNCAHCFQGNDAKVRVTRPNEREELRAAALNTGTERGVVRLGLGITLTQPCYYEYKLTRVISWAC
jgi:hypothetical protein